MSQYTAKTKDISDGNLVISVEASENQITKLKDSYSSALAKHFQRYKLDRMQHILRNLKEQKNIGINKDKVKQLVDSLEQNIGC